MDAASVLHGNSPVAVLEQSPGSPEAKAIYKEAMNREYGLNDKGGANRRNPNILEESSSFERTRSAISVD
jgi:hypothetical protein